MKDKFHNYLIPPAFFGFFQEVSYEGLGGTYGEGTDDADIVINVGQGCGYQSMTNKRA